MVLTNKNMGVPEKRKKKAGRTKRGRIDRWLKLGA